MEETGPLREIKLTADKIHLEEEAWRMRRTSVCNRPQKQHTECKLNLTLWKAQMTPVPHAAGSTRSG